MPTTVGTLPVWSSALCHIPGMKQGQPRDIGQASCPGGGERQAQPRSHWSSANALCRQVQRRQTSSYHSLLHPSLAWHVLFARPRSCTCPWTACVSLPKKAFSSGRAPATVTLILPKKSSLWTTYRLGRRPYQPGGEGTGCLCVPPVCATCSVRHCEVWTHSVLK